MVEAAEEPIAAAQINGEAQGEECPIPADRMTNE